MKKTITKVLIGDLDLDGPLKDIVGKWYDLYN